MSIQQMFLGAGGGLSAVESIDYLVIAGGGAGYGQYSGGGGAGGITHVTGYTLLENTYEISIGAGGSTGTDSHFKTATSDIAVMSGGGRGGTYAGGDDATSGGSGGGGGMSGGGGAAAGASASDSTYGGPGYTGHNTTNYHGGGGGALGNTVSTQKNGADGPAYSITGASTNYAGGGGGGSYSTSAGAGGAGGGGAGTGGGITGADGTANTGGGGGGFVDSTGGSGLVIIAYSNASQQLTSIDATLTYTLDTSSRPGYLVYKFTAGSGDITFNQNMAHYALLNDSNKVVAVITGKDEENGVDWEQRYSEVAGKKALRTSYNTHGNTHKNGGTPFRANYAGIGDSYDPVNDVFIAPKPFESWVLNSTTYLWEAPTPHGDPEDGLWLWSEVDDDPIKQGWNLIATKPTEQWSNLLSFLL